MARKTESDPRLLTELELKMMTILWNRGDSTVRETLASLPPDLALAYTTVSTVLRILEQKGQVESRKEGRVHIYHPLLTQEEHASLAVENLVNKVFDGRPHSLVARLIDVDGISDGDLAEIRAMIDSKLSDPEVIQ